MCVLTHNADAIIIQCLGNLANALIYYDADITMIQEMAKIGHPNLASWSVSRFPCKSVVLVLGGQTDTTHQLESMGDHMHRFALHCLVVASNRAQL